MKRMKTIAWVGCSAVLLVLLGSAQAEERRYWDEISGTAAPTTFDGNGDGSPAHYVTFSGNSSLGPVHGGFLVDGHHDFLEPSL